MLEENETRQAFKMSLAIAVLNGLGYQLHNGPTKGYRDKKKLGAVTFEYPGAGLGGRGKGKRG